MSSSDRLVTSVAPPNDLSASQKRIFSSTPASTYGGRPLHYVALPGLETRPSVSGTKIRNCVARSKSRSRFTEFAPPAALAFLRNSERDL